MTLMDNSVDSKVHDHGFDPPISGINSWTEERVNLLIELKERGIKRKFIADKINSTTGSNFSVAAIGSKIDRLLPPGKPRKTQEEKAAVIKAQRERYNAKKREDNRLKRGAAPLRSTPFRPPFEVEQPKIEFRPEFITEFNVHGVENLEPANCRYIINDDMSAPIYCGAGTFNHGSWCAGHRRLVFRPLEKRSVAA